MSVHKLYTKELHEQLNYNATWLPTLRLAPGDVCTMTGHHLQVVSNLREFGVGFEIEGIPVQADFDYASQGDVSIHVKASGDAPPQGSLLELEEAGISLSFARASAVVLRLEGCSAQRIRSLHQVGTQILQLHHAEKWPKGYVVIGEVVTAGASTIIISSGSGAGIDLTAKGALSAGSMTLANMDAAFSVKRESNIGAKIISMPGLTPLVRVSGIRKSLLRKEVFKGRALPLPFGPVDYDDFSTGTPS